MNDSSSHDRLSIKTKTLEDILKESQNNQLLRRALQNELRGSNGRLNTEEWKTDLKRLISMSKSRLKNRQSQLYKVRQSKFLTISNNETNHEEVEEAKLRHRTDRKDSVGLSSHFNMKDPGLLTDKPNSVKVFTIPTQNAYNSEVKAIAKLVKFKKSQWVKKEQSDKSQSESDWENGKMDDHDKIVESEEKEGEEEFQQIEDTLPPIVPKKNIMIESVPEVKRSKNRLNRVLNLDEEDKGDPTEDKTQEWVR